MKISQNEFNYELINFIHNHPYYQQVQGTTSSINNDEQVMIFLPDPDGDYEETQISISLIS